MRSEEGVKLQLAFLPHLAEAGEKGVYRCFLLNPEDRNFLYEVQFETQTRSWEDRKGRLEAGGFCELQSLAQEDLNDRAVYCFFLWEILERGTGSAFFCELSLRPKSFFTKRQYHEVLERDVHLYTLVLQQKNGEAETLSDYVRRQRGETPPPVLRNPNVEIHSPEELASFPREIDLHIEVLVEDSGGMDAAQMLCIQLEAFEKYLERAIRLGVDRVRIIHGKGEGVLRRRIHELLGQNPQVKHFEKIHPVLGTGVTEVFF